ncbi:MAG TPA: diguanylate cyclase [Candidatus Obscuribacterales bacterium]
MKVLLVDDRTAGAAEFVNKLQALPEVVLERVAADSVVDLSAHSDAQLVFISSTWMNGQNGRSLRSIVEQIGDKPLVIMRDGNGRDVQDPNEIVDGEAAQDPAEVIDRQSPRNPREIVDGEAAQDPNEIVDGEAARGPGDAGNIQYLTASQLTEDVLRHAVAVAQEKRLAALLHRIEHQSMLLDLRAAVTEVLNTPSTLQAMLQACAQAIVDFVGTAFARIWVFDALENVLVLKASAGMYTHLDGKHRRIKLGEFKIGRIGQERKPHLSNNVLHDTWVSDPEWAKRENMVAFAGYPLVIGDRLLGVIGTFSRHLLTDATLEVLASISKAIALGIDRFEAEEKLHNLADLVEFADDAIFSCDRKSIVTSWNKGCERLFGIPAADIVGQSVAGIAPQDAPISIEEIDRTLGRGERIEGIKAHYERPDGKRVCLLGTISPIHDDSGNVVGGVAIAKDVTDNEHLIDELRGSEERFRQIAASAHDGIVCIDSDGRITLWNHAAEAIFGHPSENVMGVDVHKLVVPGKFREAVERGMQVFKKTGGGPVVGKTQELEALRADGSVFPIEISISSIFMGGQWQAIGILRDITERRRAEELIKASEQALIKDRNSLAAANARLGEQAAALEEHSQQMEKLTEMAEFLQLCLSERETVDMIATFAPQLFPQSSGGLLMFGQASGPAEGLSTWGEIDKRELVFDAEDCWAGRRGQAHRYVNHGRVPKCAHISYGAFEYMCVPILHQGEVLGILHIRKDQISSDEEKLAIRVISDASLSIANLRLREQLKEMSIRDALTDLYNRRYMEEFFSKELIRVKRKDSPLSVIMMDIDHFKDFNDEYGHDAGDVVLREIARLLARFVRGSDIVCRYGGEEFIAILPDTPLSTAVQRAEQIRLAVKEVRVQIRDSHLRPLNLSLGVSSFPENGSSIDDIIHAADVALYEAKQKGRDRVCAASPPPSRSREGTPAAPA